VTVAGWVMVGSAATSAACCLLPRAQATPRAQANAVGMLTVMVLAITVPSPFMHRAGALFLLTLAAGLGLGLVEAGSLHWQPEHARAAEWHRATGSVLTAAALLLHEHAGGAIVVQAFTVAYAAWTLATVLSPHASMTQRLRWEHVAKATCLSAMVFAGTM